MNKSKEASTQALVMKIIQAYVRDFMNKINKMLKMTCWFLAVGGEALIIGNKSRGDLGVRTKY